MAASIAEHSGVAAATPVVIVGAGPTGLTLALLLARAGVRCTVIERHSEPQAHPAACILDTRTMEIFREIGVAGAILESCQNVFERARITWVTTLAGRELGHCSALPDDLARTLALSPVHTTQFPQNRLEPLLWKRVRDNPLITFLPGSECTQIVETKDLVTCMIAGTGGSAISTKYVVACDGSSSTARRLLGISVEGRTLQHVMGVYFTADLAALIDHRKSVLYWTFDPKVLGVLIAHWLPNEWVLFVPYFPILETKADYSDPRCRALVEAAIGQPTPDLTIKLVRPWVMATSLADKFQRGRVFLAGDAAHNFPPTGGLGLNTGVQDAHNLAWKLSAVLKDQADPLLLGTYEQERRPVARRNLQHSESNYYRMSDLLRVVGLDLKFQRLLLDAEHAPLLRWLPREWKRRMIDLVLRIGHSRLSVFSSKSPRGARARREFQRRIPGQVAHYQFTGLDLGFTYERGAFIPEPSRQPDNDDPVVNYRPTTWPSARLPHFWVLRDGERLSVHDILARDSFTLLTHSGGDHAWRLAADAIRSDPSLPLQHFSIGSRPPADFADEEGRWPELSEVDPTGAVLVRPDGHVAWRTLTLPSSPTTILSRALKRVLCWTH